MSALKEEWANLMKLRGSGRVEENKAEDVKNRIFQNFQHMLKGHTTDLPKEFNKAQVKPEFEALRTKVQSVFHGIVERDKDNKAKDIAKQFVFGLNSQRSKTPVPTTIRARKESQEVPGTIDEI